MVFGSHFIFDGVDSRDYNLLLCSFDGFQDEELSMGLGIEPITTELRDRTIDYGGKWSEVITFEFTVAHDPEYADEAFSRQEIREIVSWLTASKDLKWLSVYDEDDTEYFYFCRFTNIRQKKFGGKTIGLIMEITCDSPFAYSDIKQVEVGTYTTYEESIVNFDYHLHTDTDVEITPNILVCLSNATDFSIGMCFSAMNTNEQNRHRIYIDNYEAQPGAVLIDTQNMLALYSKDNDLLSNPTSGTPLCAAIQSNAESEAYKDFSLGFQLLKDNYISLQLHTFLVTHQDIPDNTDIRIVLQYREKYKAGVF